LSVNFFGCAAVAPQFIGGISSGEALGILGVLLTIVGLVLAVRSRTRARLAYQIRDLTLIGQPDATPYGDVRILFNGEPVRRLVVTRLAFWNAGNTTVRRADLVEKDPLAVCFEEKTTILGSRTVSKTRAVNECRLALNHDFPSRALMTFDYLDRGDGAVFEIIHTGSRGGASIRGSIRGIPNGVENWGYLSEREMKKTSFWQEWAPSFIMAGPVVLALILHWLQSAVAQRHPTLASIFGIASIVLICALAGLFVIAILFALGFMARSFLRRLPKTLQRNS
jgi:hypothetical protein